ncbi:MAG: PEP-CTERM sorting domain-containing protein [Gemmatales bacterium]
MQFPWFSGDNASIRSLGANRGGGPADIWLSFLANPNQTGQGLYLYFTSQQDMQIGSPLAGGGLGMQLNSLVTGGATQTLNVSPTINIDSSTHFFVTHFQLGASSPTNTITLYVDPDFNSLANGLAPTGGSSVTYTTALNFNFERFLIGNFSGVTGAAGTFSLDEIRLGPTWISVSAVPEPTTMALAALALCGSWYCWRRKVRQAQTVSDKTIEHDVVVE